MKSILDFLNEADERRERASPGPWNAYDWPSFPRRDEYDSCVRIESEKAVTAFCFSGKPNNDAVFIAASRTEHEKLSRALRVAVEHLSALEVRNTDPELGALRNMAAIGIDRIAEILEG